MGARLEVTTWPSGKHGYFALRDFEVSDGGGDPVLSATSSWMVIGLDKKQPVKVDEAIAIPYAVDKRALADPFDSLAVPAARDAEVGFRVESGHIDWNRHVNNAVYVQWALEAVPPDVLQTVPAGRPRGLLPGRGLLRGRGRFRPPAGCRRGPGSRVPPPDPQRGHGGRADPAEDPLGVTEEGLGSPMKRTVAFALARIRRPGVFALGAGPAGQKEREAQAPRTVSEPGSTRRSSTSSPRWSGTSSSSSRPTGSGTSSSRPSGSSGTRTPARRRTSSRPSTSAASPTPTAISAATRPGPAGGPTGAACTSSWASRRDIQRFEGKSSTYDTEVWFYQGLTDLGLPAGFNLVFFKEDGRGEYQLYSPVGDGPQALLTGYFGSHGLHGRLREAPGVRARAGRRLPLPHSRRRRRRTTAGRRCAPTSSSSASNRPRPATSRPSTPRSSSSTRTSSRSNTRPTISTATA